MKIHGKINQISSCYNNSFLNIADFEDVAIGVWGIPTDLYLFREKGDYGNVFLISTDNIEGFREYLQERDRMTNYEFLGCVKDLK